MKRIIKLSFGLLLSISSIYGSEESIIMGDNDSLIAGMRYLSQKNFKGAADCFESLAKQGHGQAQYFYGSLLFSGSGVTKNSAIAFQYYNLAEKSSDLPEYIRHSLEYCIANMYVLGDGVDQDENTGLEFFIRAGEGNNTTALIALGQIYLHGHGSIEKNLEKAKHWLEKASLAGDALSSFSLGQMYYNRDLKQDTSKAVQLFLKAES